MDECFNFPPLESQMGDEPKEACKVRRAHQTRRQDGEAMGTPAERIRQAEREGSLIFKVARAVSMVQEQELSYDREFC